MRFTVIEIPNSALATDLMNCAPAYSTPHDPGGAKPEDTIEDVLSVVFVGAEVRISTVGALNPSTVDLSGMRFQAVDVKSKAIVTGGPADTLLTLPPGTYLFELKYGSETWTETKTVNADATVKFGIPAGAIQVSAVREGVTIGDLDLFRLIDSAGREVVSQSNFDLAAANFSVAPGSYTVSGTLNGSISASNVTIASGKISPVVLNFSSAPSPPRSVTIELDIRRPTLDVGPYAPEVELIAPKGRRTALTRPSNFLSLEAGTYRMRVGASTPHEMDFDVPGGRGPLTVGVVVTPGWFEAKAPSVKGQFELQEKATGRPLRSFVGDTVRHSLPDGDYVLVFRGSDGGELKRAFSITTGDFTPVAFR